MKSKPNKATFKFLISQISVTFYLINMLCMWPVSNNHDGYLNIAPNKSNKCALSPNKHALHISLCNDV